MLWVVPNSGWSHALGFPTLWVVSRSIQHGPAPGAAVVGRQVRMAGNGGKKKVEKDQNSKKTKGRNKTITKKQNRARKINKVGNKNEKSKGKLRKGDGKKVGTGPRNRAKKTKTQKKTIKKNRQIFFRNINQGGDKNEKSKDRLKKGDRKRVGKELTTARKTEGLKKATKKNPYGKKDKDSRKEKFTNQRKTLSKMVKERSKKTNKAQNTNIKENKQGLNPIPPTTPQTYGCDFYRLTKAQSVSRTQLNRAVRILTKTAEITLKSSIDASYFATVLRLLSAATDNGTTCAGGTLDATGVEIYNILNNCSISVPAICDVALINQLLFPELISDYIISANVCRPLLDDFGTDYKVKLLRLNKMRELE